eukprot:m.92578 g.92578  ORF g.92578 m.92578 type:complete len:344 (-) comp8894_c3_seq2:273-1304(-)
MSGNEDIYPVTDNRQQSSFVSMLVGTSPEKFPISDPVQICSETLRSAHLCAEALLLRSRDLPMSNSSLTMCHDSVIALSKAVASQMKTINNAVMSDSNSSIPKPLAELAESLVLLVETVADTIFQIGSKSTGTKAPSPSVIDSYVLSRARLAISLCIEHLEESSLNTDRMMAVLSVMATHLEAVKECNAQAIKRTKNKQVVLQLKATNKGLTGSTAAFIVSAKSFATKPCASSQRHVIQFSKPLVALVDALLTFSISEELVIGKPSQPDSMAASYIKSIEAAALSLVSAVSLFLKTVKTTLTQSVSAEYFETLTKYLTAANVHLSELRESVKKALQAELVPTL